MFECGVVAGANLEAPRPLKGEGECVGEDGNRDAVVSPAFPSAPWDAVTGVAYPRGRQCSRLSSCVTRRSTRVTFSASVGCPRPLLSRVGPTGGATAGPLDMYGVCLRKVLRTTPSRCTWSSGCPLSARLPQLSWLLALLSDPHPPPHPHPSAVGSTASLRTWCLGAHRLHSSHTVTRGAPGDGGVRAFTPGTYRTPAH